MYSFNPFIQRSEISEQTKNKTMTLEAKIRKTETGTDEKILFKKAAEKLS